MNKEVVEKIVNSIGYESRINGREEYLNSVVLVPLFLIDGEYHLLLEKRSAGIRQGGEICFPGGKIDLEDGTLQDTAIRETVEELGISRERIRIVGRLDTVVAPLGAIVDAFIGLIDIQVPEIIFNKQEVDELIVLPLEYFLSEEPKRFPLHLKVHPSGKNQDTGEEVVFFPAMDLGIPEKYWKPWGHFEYSTYVYQTTQGVIWGITARLIMDLVQRIKERNQTNEY